MMTTKRKDGRGHWPAGRRRNDQPPPSGWPTVDRFLSDVHAYCASERKTKDLAEYLGVDRKTVYTWLTGDKWPARDRMLAIARWYRAQRRRR